MRRDRAAAKVEQPVVWRTSPVAAMTLVHDILRYGHAFVIVSSGDTTGGDE
jgi:hypothetical protein